MARAVGSLFFESPRHVAIRPTELQRPGPDDAFVIGLASGISQGTEMLLYRGEGPRPFDVGLGAIDYPCRYGYAWVGTDDGKRIFALAPHATAHVLPKSALRSMREDIPGSRATLAANLETAVTCAWDADVALGDRVVVLGAGVIGMLTAWILARTAKVMLVDPRASRLQIARGLMKLADVAKGAADVVVEASGNPQALDDAIAWAAPNARILVASFYGQRRAPIDLGDAFHRRRLSLVASQVSAIPPRLTPRWDYARRFDLVLDLLGEPLLDTLIATAPFATAAEVYERLDREDHLPPAHVFTY